MLFFDISSCLVNKYEAVSYYANNFMPNDANHFFLAPNETTAAEHHQYTLTVQKYVISFHKKSATDFGFRNAISGLNDTTWFPASNGWDQKIADEVAAAFRNFKRFNVSTFKSKSQGGYDNPHHVGCFFSHWNLLRLSLEGWISLGKRPDALFVFEDDATCVKDTVQRTLDLIPKLPLDWDYLYIGGKPFSYFEEPINRTKEDYQAQQNLSFRQLACSGALGIPKSGPFAPDGSRNLPSSPDSYWKTKYLTNTHALVINPQSADRIMKFLEEPTLRGTPVDIILAGNYAKGSLNAYMPSQEFCVQGHHPNQEHPRPWEGYHHHKFRGPKGEYKWEEMHFADCPQTYEQGQL